MIKRVGHSIFIILGLMALLFFSINILGDPISLLVDEEASEAAIEALRAEYGLDRPLIVRFGDFYANLATFNFGKSIRHPQRHAWLPPPYPISRYLSLKHLKETLERLRGF